MASKCQLSSSYLQMPNESAMYGLLNDIHSTYQGIHPYLAACICLSGVFMNIASVIVLTRPSMIVSPINCLLTVIAVCDAVTMMSCFNYLIRVLTFTDCPSRYTYEWIFTVLFNSNLTVIGHTVSIWLTVSMAVIRACTVKQAWGGVMRSTKALTMAFYITVGTFACVCLLNIPSALAYKIVSVPVSGPCNSTASLYANLSSPLYVYVTDINCDVFRLAFWINGVLFKLLPCVMLTVFIGVLIFILAEVRRRRVRLRLTTDSRRTDRTTLMLVVLLSVFLLSELPQGILLIGTGVYDYTFRRQVYSKLGDLMDLLSLINSAANFVIYFAMSQKFREVFCRTLVPIMGPAVCADPNRLTLYATEGEEMTLRVGNMSNMVNGHQVQMQQRSGSRFRLNPMMLSLISKKRRSRSQIFETSHVL